MPDQGHLDSIVGLGQFNELRLLPSTIPCKNINIQ